MKVKKIIKTDYNSISSIYSGDYYKNPDKALATQTGEDDVYAELTDVQLDDSHSIKYICTYTRFICI